VFVMWWDAVGFARDTPSTDAESREEREQPRRKCRFGRIKQHQRWCTCHIRGVCSVGITHTAWVARATEITRIVRSVCGTGAVRALVVCCRQCLCCGYRALLPLSIKGRGNLTHEVCDLGIARPATSSERKQRCRARTHLQQFEQLTLGTSGVVEHADGCERTELQLVRCAPHNRKVRVKSWGHSRDNALFDRSVSKVIHRQAPTAPRVERSTRTAVCGRTGAGLSPSSRGSIRGVVLQSVVRIQLSGFAPGKSLFRSRDSASS